MPRKGFRLPIEINPVYLDFVLAVHRLETAGIPVYASSPHLKSALKVSRPQLERHLRFLHSEGYLKHHPSKGRRVCYVVNKDHVSKTMFVPIKESYEKEKQRYHTWEELIAQPYCTWEELMK